jgi:hypothetical protein
LNWKYMEKIIINNKESEFNEVKGT